MFIKCCFRIMEVLLQLIEILNSFFLVWYYSQGKDFMKNFEGIKRPSLNLNFDVK